MKRFIRLISDRLNITEDLRYLKRSLFGKKKEKELKNKRIDFYSKVINKGDLVFDIGANVGNRIESFLSLGASVIAVEPQKNCAEYLRKKFKKSQVIVIEKGVGEKEEIKKMYISSKANTLSSFSHEWIEKVQKGRFSEYEWDKTTEIVLTTLENLINEYGLPKFCKVDVEGYELEVFKGLAQPIEHISFEYAVPENTEMLFKIVSYINTISNKYSFNYSIGESMRYELPLFQSFDSFNNMLRTQKFLDTKFGDIYCKL